MREQHCNRVNKYEDIVMREQQRHLANKCEDIVNLQGRRHIVSPRAQLVIVVISLSMTLCSWKMPNLDPWTWTSSSTMHQCASRRRSLTCVRCVVVTSCRLARTASSRLLFSHWSRVTSCSESMLRSPSHLRKYTLCTFVSLQRVLLICFVTVTSSP